VKDYSYLVAGEARSVHRESGNRHEDADFRGVSLRWNGDG
jgi:hypothetical protein